MQTIPVLLAIIVGMVVLLAAGAILEGPVVEGLRRRWPGFAYDGEATLMMGLLVLAAFAFGLLVMYALR